MERNLRELVERVVVAALADVVAPSAGTRDIDFMWPPHWAVSINEGKVNLTLMAWCRGRYVSAFPSSPVTEVIGRPKVVVREMVTQAVDHMNRLIEQLEAEVESEQGWDQEQEPELATGLVFEDDLDPRLVSIEDSGKVKYIEVPNIPPATTSDEMFVRIFSVDKRGEHSGFDALVGKRVWVTIEVAD